jgi:hypothetical protein
MRDKCKRFDKLFQQAYVLSAEARHLCETPGTSRACHHARRVIKGMHNHMRSQCQSPPPICRMIDTYDVFPPTAAPL